MYNYNHLYYFYMTVRAGSVTLAAEQLYISQPSLSSQLKVLERAMDLRLFHKVGRNNQLTPDGLVVYGFCRRMFELSEEMSELISQKIPSASRRINIGVSDEVDRPFVAEIISLFLKKHGLAQRPKVTVVSGHHEQLAERLRFHELDVVVSQLAMIEPELENLVRAEVPVVLTCSSKWKVRSHTRKLNAKTAMSEIIGGESAQWVMPSSKFRLRSEINQFVEVNALKGRIVFESDVIASLVRSVIDEIGVAFLPLIYVAREIREESIRVLGPKQGYWKYGIWLTSHKQNKNDPLVKVLASTFKEICEQS